MPNRLSYRLDSTENIVVRTFRNKTPAVSPRLSDIYSPTLSTDTATTLQRALGIGAIAVLPILTDHECRGVLFASVPTNRIRDVDLSLLEIVTGQFALAIERIYLYDHHHNREKQLNLLLETTINAQEEERERICLEIHDGIAQTLSSAFQHLQVLKNAVDPHDSGYPNVGQASQLVQTSLCEMRQVIAGRRPASLDTIGLAATLRYELNELGRQEGWQTDLEAEETRFPKAVETALYRIVHEAITNVRKHASASQVTVRIVCQHARVIIEVQDNGTGCNLHALEQRSPDKGMGLVSMRKRAELLNGIFNIDSRPGEGTRVHIEVPLSTSEDSQTDSPTQHSTLTDREWELWIADQGLTEFQEDESQYCQTREWDYSLETIEDS